MSNALELQNVSRRFSGFALRDVSFVLPGGSILGLAGENGAGKSTTIRLIMLYIANTAEGTGAVQISGAAVGQAGGIGRSADWFVAVGLPLTGLLAQPISIRFALRAWRKANFI